MRERPILFNGAMVRAILAGQKTQTRRAIKPRPFEASALDAPGQYGPSFDENGLLRVATSSGVHLLACPFGQPGDRLWVRETTVNVEKHGYRGPVHLESEEGYATLQGGLAPAPYGMTEVEPHEITLRPSIHMLRSMCRLFLEITDVRVERLQAISEADAVAEGATADVLPEIRLRHGHPRAAKPMVYEDSREIFADLWDSTGGDWNANPWVWAITFKRIDP
ncbi:TPA: hypothetical protein ACKQCT_001409 [Stenotrophomonas maltophilia]